MPRVYELPTHLQVEDQLIGTLSGRQSLQLGIGLSLAYGAWDQLRWLPEEVRWGLVLILTVVTVVFALIRPFGRPLDQWLLAGLVFYLLPRRLVWRPAVAWLRQPSREQTGWAELELRPEWLGADVSPEYEESRPGPALDRPQVWRWGWGKP
jgi:hypothetical protein